MLDLNPSNPFESFDQEVGASDMFWAPQSPSGQSWSPKPLLSPVTWPARGIPWVAPCATSLQPAPTANATGRGTGRTPGPGHSMGLPYLKRYIYISIYIYIYSHTSILQQVSPRGLLGPNRMPVYRVLGMGPRWWEVLR